MSMVPVPLSEMEGLTAIPLHLAEAFNLDVEEDPDQVDWRVSGRYTRRGDELEDGGVGAATRTEILNKIRHICTWDPHPKRALTLYESYVLGRGFGVELSHRDWKKEPTKAQNALQSDARFAWSEFIRHNKKWWTVREFGRRCWRDGECFNRKIETGSIPELRFIDPEEIDSPGNNDDQAQSHGIITATNDISDVLGYRRVDPNTEELIREYRVDEIFHTKIDCDSTLKRGMSRFLPVVEPSRQIRAFVKTEALIRAMQSSVVMTRKVRAGGQQIASYLDTQKSGTTTYRNGQTLRREKFRPGTILTHNDAVEIGFAQPDTRFSDASHLGRFLIMQVAVATGWPYYMLSCDSSDSNFAGTLVAESPTVVMVEEEQDFFASQIEDIFIWVIDQAMETGLIKSKIINIWEEFKPQFSFPNLVTRDTLQETQAISNAVINKFMSRREGARRMNMEPDQQFYEIEQESKMSHLQTSADMNIRTPGEKSDSQPANISTGTNQGDPKSISHEDKL